MYIKIVRHLQDEKSVSNSRGSLMDKVVPSNHHIFESLEAEYKKVTVSNIAEFQKRMGEIETVRIVTPIPDHDIINDELEDSSFEFIQARLTTKEDDEKFIDETLVGKDCTLYIMNNEGRTIDRMGCR